MPNNKLISILVPVYNKEKYLDNCIKSIQEQTYDNFEAIFVDDKSSDSSCDLIEKYQLKDKRIKLIRHNKNMGILSTRFDLIDAASGDYIIWLDPDDYLEKETCTIVNNEMSEEYDVVMYSYITEPEHKIITTTVSNTMLKDLLLGEIVPSIFNKCYKALLLKDSIRGINPFYFNLGDDVYISALIYNQCVKIKKIDSVLYHYVTGIGVTKKIPDEKTLKVTINSIKNYYDNLKTIIGNKVDNKYIKISRNNILYSVACTCEQHELSKYKRFKYLLMIDKEFQTHFFVDYIASYIKTSF